GRSEGGAAKVCVPIELGKSEKGLAIERGIREIREAVKTTSGKPSAQLERCARQVNILLEYDFQKLRQSVEPRLLECDRSLKDRSVKSRMRAKRRLLRRHITQKPPLYKIAFPQEHCSCHRHRLN